MARPAPETRNKQERAYGLIRERIEAGLYGPGQRLVIDSLARDFEMSQVPIREALRKLEAEGWIQYQRNSGAMVTLVSREQWQSTMEVLALLEGYATALAAPLLRPADLQRLREANVQMEEALEALDLYRFSKCNRQFHRVIWDRCPNAFLVQEIRETQAKIDAVGGMLFPSVPYRGVRSIEEHTELIDILEKPTPFAALERTARQHKLNFLEAASRMLESRQHALGDRDDRP